MAYRKISFTRAEYDALEWLMQSASTPDASPNERHWEALHSLEEKMTAAMTPPSQPLDLPVISAREYLELLQDVLGDGKVAWEDTPRSYTLMSRQLKALCWTEEDVVLLAKHVEGWWKQGPVNAHTLLRKGGEWLAMAKANKKAKTWVQNINTLDFGDDEQ